MADEVLSRARGRERPQGDTPVAAQPFTHLGVPHAEQYRRLLRTFARAKERFIVHLRPEDVAAELRVGADEQLTEALDQLVKWGNLRADVDTSRVTTVEDFHRKRSLYQLTAEGQAAEQAIAFYEEAIGRRGQLQSVALADIAGQLQALLALATESDPDPADRALVGTFLQQRIATEHADNPAAGWAEALTSALDYRSWHEFVIQRYQDGHWRPATGPASGGERALVVSVPLFAAASSHYKSAGNPHAPRLIALDEAFAGVDDDSRAKCLGLLATFDMDVVMTSEREWGCYPQVPGLGISHLARQDGVDAVLVTPWRWDGRERRRADRAAV